MLALALIDGLGGLRRDCGAAPPLTASSRDPRTGFVIAPFGASVPTEPTFTTDWLEGPTLPQWGWSRSCWRMPRLAVPLPVSRDPLGKRPASDWLFGLLTPWHQRLQYS